MDFAQAGDELLALAPDRLGSEVAAELPGMGVIAEAAQETPQRRGRDIGGDEARQHHHRMPVAARRAGKDRRGEAERAELDQCTGQFGERE